MSIQHTHMWDCFGCNPGLSCNILKDEIRAYWPWQCRGILGRNWSTLYCTLTAAPRPWQMTNVGNMMQYASAASSAERKPSVELDAIPMAMLSNCCDMLSLKFASDHLAWHLRNLWVGMNGVCLRFGCTCSSQLPCMDEVVETCHWIWTLNQEFSKNLNIPINC